MRAQLAQGRPGARRDLPALPAPATRPALPPPRVDPEVNFELLRERYPPHRVILHNDDVHAMDEVVLALRQAVPGLGMRRAMQIMLEAHLTGRSTVIVCPKEQAEHYAERIASFGLTVTIERAE